MSKNRATEVPGARSMQPIEAPVEVLLHKNLNDHTSVDVMPDESVSGEISSSKDRMAARLQEMRKRDSKIVKGIFRFYEVPNGKLEFVYSQYPGERVETYRLKDGVIYEIPLGVAKHLNKNGAYPVHERKLNDAGAVEEGPTKKVRRFGFQSLDFVDESDFSDKEFIAIEYESN